MRVRQLSRDVKRFGMRAIWKLDLSVSSAPLLQPLCGRPREARLAWDSDAKCQMKDAIVLESDPLVSRDDPPAGS